MLKRIFSLLALGFLGFTRLSAAEETKEPYYDFYSAFQTHALEAAAKINYPIDPKPLLDLLNNVKKDFPEILKAKPSTKDLTFVLNYLEPYLISFQTATPEELGPRLQKAFGEIGQLFYTNAFTLKQKAALYAILLEFAKSLQP